jgi:type I restriction enzyme M protein
MTSTETYPDGAAQLNRRELGIDPEELWQTADKLRGSIDAAEYKHVVLGLIFLKYISDAFETRREELKAELAADGIKGLEAERLLESRDEYAAENVFWVPAEARWAEIQAKGKTPNIGKLIDDAMYAIEKDNPRLKGKLPRDYARRGISPERLGGLIDKIASIAVGTKEAHKKDILGRVYEYFLGKFAAAEGKLGGEFFTPSSVVRLMVEMIEPYEGRVYDPTCGSGGMFVQSERFVEAHGGTKRDLSVFGQESNPTTWRLAHMNLAIRGIEANLGEQPADSFTRDLHPDLKADYILANPPFNISDWSGELLRSDARWKYGTPPVGNANYAWIQHFIHHLAPPNGKGGGIAAFVMANGSLSSTTGGEGEIRKKIIEADLVDCIIAMPPQLFLTTGIPVCLWFVTRDKSGKYLDKGRGGRYRPGETLFIDARDMGQMETRTLRFLTGRDHPSSPPVSLVRVRKTSPRLMSPLTRSAAEESTKSPSSLGTKTL